MSIATEIKRLQDAKQALKVSINSKGVLVTDADSISVYAEKVDLIEQCDLDEYYQKYYDEEGNTYIINSKGEKIITDERETPPTPVVGGNVRWKDSNSEWHTDYYEDGIIPKEKYSGNTSIQEVELGQGIVNVGWGAFSQCHNITSVIIPNTVTHIENYAFDGCTSLTSVEIPDSVTSIGGCAFRYCTSLENATISENVTSVLFAAFTQCYSLREINIPNSVRSIEDSLFYECYKLETVTIGEDVQGIEGRAFLDCFLAKLNSEVYGEINIPSLVTYIGSEAFKSNGNISSVNFGDSLISIGDNAFEYCDRITSMRFPSTLETIGNNCFDNLGTEGIIYCNEDWYNNLSQENIINLGNAYNWEKVWI